jgi:hypothetical protein
MSCSKNLLRGVAFVVALMLALTAVAAYGQTPLQSAEFVPGSWSLVLLPDTQKYSLLHPEVFTLQTQWIAKNKDKYDIRYVLHLGDITDENSDIEWQNAQKALSELDGKVPYALGTGNHDFYVAVGKSATWHESLLNKYFPPSKFKDWPTFGGVMKEDDTANCYHLFSAGGTDWIIIVLQWAPRNPDVAWANRVLAKYPKRKAILVTHAYLYNDSTRYDHTKKQQAWNPHSIAKNYNFPNLPVNDGEELWQKLVRKNNFDFTFNGHVLGSGLGFLASKNDHGKTTYQMLVNYQMRKGGGEGYLRILEFLPDGKTVHVKSYSPLRDKYLEDANNQFSFELDR